MSAAILEPSSSPALVPNKADAASRLALRHYEIEPGISAIYRLEGSTESDLDPFILLEVNRDTIAAGIMPLGFPPAPAIGVLHPSIIVEITPEELSRVQAGSLPLPNGWRITGQIHRRVAEL